MGTVVVEIETRQEWYIQWGPAIEKALNSMFHTNEFVVTEITTVKEDKELIKAIETIKSAVLRAEVINQSNLSS